MTGRAAAELQVIIPGETSHTEISAVSQRNWLKLEEQEALAILSRMCYVSLGWAAFLYVFFYRRGEVPCAIGYGDRRKTQDESKENKRPRRRIAARWKELDERRGLRPTGSTGTHHKASTEAFLIPCESSPTMAALAATY